MTRSRGSPLARSGIDSSTDFSAGLRFLSASAGGAATASTMAATPNHRAKTDAALWANLLASLCSYPDTPHLAAHATRKTSAPRQRLSKTTMKLSNEWLSLVKNLLVTLSLRRSCHLGIVGRDHDLVRAAGHLGIVLGELGQL